MQPLLVSVVAPRAMAAILFLAGAACAARGGAAAAAEADVTARAMAVLNENCVACHVPAKHKGDLVLTSRETALKGGKDGPALVPGKAAESRLLKLVAPGGDPHMPPKGQLAAEDVAALRAWVEAGAAWDEAALTNASPARDRIRYWKPAGRSTIPAGSAIRSP
jgi:mono/diheme cytochrome c family protein